MSVDFATLAMRVENAEAVRNMDTMAAKIDVVDKKTDKLTATTEQGRKAWQRAGGDMSKFAQELLKASEANEQAAPATNRFTASINKMRESAKQFEATRFHEQLQKAEANALRASQATSRLAEAMQKMRAAAAQGQASAMASMISAADPFQKQAIAMEAVAKAAPVAALNVKGLASAMSTLALGASALPGSLGRIGSILGTFAMGSGPMIAILAGLAALAFAFEKITEKSRAAAQATADAISRAQGLLRSQRQGDFGSSKDDLGSLWTKALDIGGEIRAKQALKTPGNFLGNGTIDAEIKVLQVRQAKVLQLISAENAEIARIEQEQRDEQLRKDKEANDKRIAEAERLLRAQRDLTTSQGESIDGKAKLSGLTPDFMRVGGAPSIAKIQADMSVHLARFGASMAGNLALAARIAKIVAETTEKQRAMGMLRDAGLSALTTYGGAAGGVLAGGIQGAMQGGPWGAAVGAGTALVGMIVGMGRASKEAALAMQQLRDSLNNTILSWKAELGLPGADKAFKEAQIRSQTNAAIQALDASTPSYYAGGRVFHKDETEYQKQLALIKDLEQKRLAALGKEKDAIDGLTNSMVNMVQGYKLQAAIFQAANPRGPARGRLPHRPPIWGGGGDSGDLTVPVILDGQIVATSVLKNFKRLAQQRSGSTEDWAAAI